MAFMLIETELTPNPATRKFLPGRIVMDVGTRDFATPEAAEVSPLATTLFSLGDVIGVHFGRNFVSVTAAPGADWTMLQADVASILADHFALRGNLHITCFVLVTGFKGFAQNAVALLLHGLVNEHLALLGGAVAQRVGLLFLFCAGAGLAYAGLQRCFKRCVQRFLRCNL